MSNKTNSIKMMIEKLENCEFVSPEQCELVQEELASLRVVRENRLKEQVMNAKLDTLLNDFCNSADRSKNILNCVLETVSAGKVPDVEVVQEMNAIIESLRDQYEVIYLYASKSLPSEELPQSGSSAFDYIDAVTNSKTLMYKKQLDDIKCLLERFIAVKALMEQYSAALAPFQEKAKDLLHGLIEEHIDLEVAIEKANNASIFMEALEHDNVADSKGADLLQQVAMNMDFMVQVGLATKTYYLDSNITKLQEVNNGMDDAINEGKESNIDAEIFEAKETNNEINEHDVVELTYDDSKDIELEEPCLDDNINEQESKELSEFVNAIIEKKLILHDNSCFGKLTKDISLNEDKKLSATIFTNDLRKGDVRVAVNIIRALYINLALTESALANEFDISRDLLSITISQLMKRGYVRKYSIKYGELVVPSPRLITALSYKSASSFVNLKQNCFEGYTYAETGDEHCVAALIALSAIKEYANKIRESKGMTEFVHVDDGALLLKLNYNDEDDIPDLAIGQFWKNVSTCDSFIEVIKEQLNTYEGKAKNIYIPGLNFEKAQNFAEILINELNLKEFSSKLILYSIDDNEFRVIEDESFDERKDEILEPNVRCIKEVDSSEENDKDEIVAVKDSNLEKDIIEEDFSSDIMSIEKMIADGFFYAAIAYAKAEAELNPDMKELYNQLKYAFNEPSGNCNYTSSNLYTLISKNNELENALVISAALRTFFSNQVRYDHGLKSVYGALNDYSLLNSVPQLRQIMYDMSEFKAVHNTGVDYYADYHKREQNELDSELTQLRKEAAEFYSQNVTGIIKEKTGHKRFFETKKLIFATNGEIGEYLKLVVDGELEAKELIIDFLSSSFYNSDSLITETTIDENMLWAYIQEFWDKAGQMMAFKKRDDLKSHLKSNILSRTMKAVQILAKWCNLVELMDTREEDEVIIAYKKVQKSLLENLPVAIADLDVKSKDNKQSLDSVAGAKVLHYTLTEIKRCLEGSYDERERKYFYIDFLLTDDVMLDELYLPDIDAHSTGLKSLSVQTRIINHISELKTCKYSLEHRLKQILEEQGDDFGSAQLIVKYLSDKYPETEYDSYQLDIDASVAYARETAELRKADFVGELELAQSYGQIDSSTEDQKEIILKAIDDWFEWADTSLNYGFFKRVIDEYMVDIRRNAKNREKDILEELEAFKLSTNFISIEAKERKIEKILLAIKEQNYTVAEDILSRDDFDDDGTEALIEEDYLKDFLDNYDDFYQPVSNKAASLANLVKSRTRNKEERGAKRLADNWLPGGSKIGKDRLNTLLKNLGFDVEDITAQSTIGRFEEYKVRTVGAFKRQRNSYTHPIAALGSGAAEAGFRVVCLNGVYDADNLIDHMKQIGNAKHTLILLDCALTMDERRRLARKTKNSLGDKLFVVLDRTVMMYLIRNYDETKVNRMLVSLITPFAYYQPYVWESANVMPPEIFMGRKLELEKIKSPTGVNIVYGGRQLGKSALLKKAKEDIDWNENGDRAVYIDIKGLSYKETARKICHELVDQFILEDDLDTDNWDELARAVRRRLQNNEKKIPYLLLLLDEADTFIESCSTINYKPFDSLKEIQSIGAGRFKFVVAGLRDIVRFKRDALANNSVLTHLEPMTVTPFNFSEARDLMEIPLHYLGLRFPKGNESLVTLIMATTNYFPGLIQLYCAKLIDAMRNKDYAGYNEADSPIYEVSEAHIKKVLADPDFMQQIREKYTITLKLDEDNYYHLIALIIAWLYHNEGGKSGYSAEDIQRIGIDYGICKLTELEISKLENFCEELKELNVLRKTEEHRYLFTRFTFFQMMGTADEIDTALSEYMEG